MLLNAEIMPVTPEYLLDLKNFLNDVQEILKETQTATNVKRVFQNEMKSLTEISGEFSNHFQSIMAVEWWRNRREKTKRRLIDNGFPLKYTRADATQAHKLLLEITKNPEHVYSIMFGSAMTFDKRDLYIPARFMYEECLKTGFPSPLDRGILHENIAVMLRKQRKPKLMVREMKKAIEEYREVKNNYRVCVALKNLGEAEWKLGFKETGKRYFTEAETMSRSLEQSEQAGVLWNLAYAARRIQEEKMECNYLVKCMSTCTDDQTNLVIECENRINQLQC